MNTEVSFVDSLRLRYRHIEYRFQQYRLTGTETIVADTQYGKIKGIKRTSIYDVPFFAFEKIPYAKPPINELRFKAPVPPEPWTEVLDCTGAYSKPMQMNIISGKADGSEDCLHVNVYTKDMKPTKQLPVMVWIYGGAFQIGEGNRDISGPELLIEKDIVLVTMNYRVGPLGFLSLNDPSVGVPGNAGLKDQVLAIRWVKSNCAHFGGDPNNITVFGESAGGASTHYMTLTDQTKDLFHKAIIMSGSAIAPWALMDTHKFAYRLAKICGYTGANTDKEVYEFLKKAKAKDLCGHDDKLFTEEEILKGEILTFVPCIEPYISDGCVIPKHPLEMIKTAWSNHIPFMTGITTDEGLILHGNNRKNPKALQLLDTCAAFIPQEVAKDQPETVIQELAHKIKSTHLKDGQPIDHCTLANLLAYKVFLHPMQRTILRRFKYATAPTYLYRFAFESHTFINQYYYIRWGKETHGASHADELTYLFSQYMGRRQDKNSKEYKVIQAMVGLWTQFAKTSNPNCEVIESGTLKPLDVNDDKYQCVNIDDTVKVIDWPEYENVRVWDSLYPKDLL